LNVWRAAGKSLGRGRSRGRPPASFVALGPLPRQRPAAAISENIYVTLFYALLLEKMDFLKSAVASIATKGSNFPYSFGDRVDYQDQSIWTLHNGTRRVGAYPYTTYLEILLIIWQEDGSKCSIFSFDISANRSRLPLARNALRKFKTLRHPGIVKVLDTIEVGISLGTYKSFSPRSLEDKVDRPAYLHRHRKNNASELVDETESTLRAESDMGTAQCRQDGQVHQLRRSVSPWQYKSIIYIYE
jgi:hypothetical protein